MNRFSRPLASVVSVVVASLAVACGAPPSDPGASSEPAASASVVEHIDARTIAAQPEGRSTVLDMTRADVAYELDPASGPIDLSRLVLRFGGGREVPMNEWLAAAAKDGVDISKSTGTIVLRPTQSLGGEGSVHPMVDCIAVCTEVCGESGECVRSCISSCSGGGEKLPM